MKKTIIALLACLLTFGALPALGEGSHHHSSFGDCYRSGHDDYSIEFDEGSLIISEDGRRGDEVEITEDYELYINGDLIKTNKEQKQLLKEYYTLVDELVEKAEDIGWEGGKIGIAGAKIGMQALGGVFKMLLTDYTEEEFESDIELKAEELEERAEELEEEAEKLEDIAEEIEDRQIELAEEIPELEDLGWFE
ncbi:MAG: YggN family protein [FCB group bacterium]|nr:YggN family protein [FCB group bacterium]